MNKTIREYFETHTEPVELAFGTFYSAADGNVRLVMRDGSEITAFDEEDLQDFYEEPCSWRVSYLLRMRIPNGCRIHV